MHPTLPGVGASARRISASGRPVAYLKSAKGFVDCVQIGTNCSIRDRLVAAGMLGTVDRRLLSAPAVSAQSSSGRCSWVGIGRCYIFGAVELCWQDQSIICNCVLVT